MKPSPASPAVGRLARAERSAAVDLVARAMVDNPLHVAAYGDDPDVRLVAHRRLVGGAIGVMDALDVLALRSRGRVVGVAGMVPAGRCRPTARQRLRLLPVLARLGPRAGRRVAGWLGEWSRHDLREPHVHVGPVAVHPDLQGRGLGTRLMAAVCAELDSSGLPGYLETDKAANVPFYEGCGFEVVGSASVIGVENWFMRRPSAAPVQTA
ncbi:GNAT family N-acetyltransferase [Nocardioides sp. zg-1228]|uniref:GNAT family N-acetyltransferase n=1 Tax=Nocardioides sp. zg-1228 TaxID=2763008 RepID=UPI0016431AE7|nr:GNAT family N-acetyltransferase [Nocardioides sp. zg-1228]MBC2932828.1 GNAT family N-acetyltransferase [Nocardioides sp. zg-1228]QSF56957.1 GNAT family N-acetyltransferase [Nocardioides sp. zg-1228]